jgi:hypothetical protein
MFSESHGEVGVQYHILRVFTSSNPLRRPQLFFSRPPLSLRCVVQPLESLNERLNASRSSAMDRADPYALSTLRFQARTAS